MRKTIILSAALLFMATIASAQYFKGSWERDASSMVNLKIIFKMKPTADITTQLSYIETAFRFPTATTPSFTVDNISSNAAAFPGLAFQRFTPDYAAAGFTYYKFVFNTAIVGSNTYSASSEYPLFTITTSLPANATPAFEMVSNLQLGEYQFGAINGAGNLIDPGVGDQLYGSGYSRSGSTHIVPLFSGVLPVTFKSFTVTKQDKDALVKWSVENQSPNTSYFEIERSTNGTSFTTIAKIDALHTSSSTASYSAIDPNIIVLDKPVIYYRLKQTDRDGRFVYTDVQVIRLQLKGNAATVFPNPAVQQAVLTWHLAKKQPVSISVVDDNGKIVEQIAVAGLAGVNQLKLDVARLASANYKLVIRAGDTTETLSLVVKH